MQTFKDWDALHLGWQTAEDIWNAAVEAARADLLKPSPCGQKFADGTLHPMACWIFNPNDSGPDDLIGQSGYCLICRTICDSEAKLRVEMKDADDRAEASNESVLDDNELLQNKLTALREGLAGLVEKWHRESVAAIPPEYAGRGLHGKYLRLDNYAAGQDNCADELSDFLTPPAASRRESLCECATDTTGPHEKRPTCGGEEGQKS